MVKSQIRIRRTELPGVVELELMTPRNQARSIAIEPILRRHRTQKLACYVTNTSLRAILRAKLCRIDGREIQTDLIGALLDELQTAMTAIASAPMRAA